MTFRDSPEILVGCDKQNNMNFILKYFYLFKNYNKNTCTPICYMPNCNTWEIPTLASVSR